MQDELYKTAKEIVIADQNATISNLMRKLYLSSFYRAKNLIEELEKNEIISKPNVRGLREILIQK